jgi:hypothetical protein
LYLAASKRLLLFAFKTGASASSYLWGSQAGAYLQDDTVAIRPWRWAMGLATAAPGDVISRINTSALMPITRRRVKSPLLQGS